MDIAPLALIGGLIFALTTFVRRVLPVELYAWQTQLISFAIGVGVVFLVAAAEITGKTVAVNSVLLSDYDTASKIVLGLLATGLFAVVPDHLMAAIDNNRSSQVRSETKDNT